jgi:hypothetical protein
LQNEISDLLIYRQRQKQEAEAATNSKKKIKQKPVVTALMEQDEELDRLYFFTGRVDMALVKETVSLEFCTHLKQSGLLQYTTVQKIDKFIATHLEYQTVTNIGNFQTENVR